MVYLESGASRLTFVIILICSVVLGFLTGFVDYSERPLTTFLYVSFSTFVTLSILVYLIKWTVKWIASGFKEKPKP